MMAEQNPKLSRPLKQTNRSAFTRFELVVVIALVAILALLVLAAAITNFRRQARQAQCLNNLNLFGMATKLWSADHGDRYPWHIKPNDGGTWGIGAAWVHFNILSNEAGLPKIFLCPSDTERHLASSFAIGQPNSVSVLTNGCLSYGFATEVERRDYGSRKSHLAIDRNLTNYDIEMCGAVNFKVAKLRYSAKWTEKLHNLQGNVLCADGSVHSMNQSNLTVQLLTGMPQAADSNVPNCTLIP